MSTSEQADLAPSGYRDDSGTRYRVLFFMRVEPGEQEAFRRAYEQIRWKVAEVPGHLRDQLCQSTRDPAEWLITSEWASEEHFLTWEGDPAHRRMVAPMIRHTAERESLRFAVRATTETPH
ncbi:antibiotic biosynthesis monooxygenase family protein [Actinomadura miaoliensis]|uniref:ABM domain-containing protein n=1 Tax=Actinomadura miaoliensis TaxID=430685 RepID=A0ABP7W082_9ACTN